MPYSKEHKKKTRERILHSAYSLFSTKGFERVTVDHVMMDCSLTRGAFYAHFKNKAELYGEALKLAATNSALAKRKPDETPSKEWLGKLLDGYLSVEHVNGEMPCPLAFLATDIVSRDNSTKKTYTETYKNMNKIIMDYAGENAPCCVKGILPLTSMIIGAVAVSRTINDTSLVEKILTSCRQQARSMLDGI